jgi:uncharacterized protein (DUF433 family)
MTRVQEVEHLLADLTPSERAEVLASALRQWGDGHPGIVSTPGVCGGNPCIIRTRIPVWLLESQRRQGASDAELLDAYPQLHAQDLVNAWAYVSSHHAEIDRQIAEQEAA